MNDADSMGRGKRVSDLAGVIQGICLSEMADMFPQRNTFYKFADDVGCISFLPEFMDRKNVWMVKGRSCTGLSLQSLNEFRSARKVNTQNFNGHLALKLRVLGQINFAHSPAPQQGRDLIPTNVASAEKRRRFQS